MKKILLPLILILISIAITSCGACSTDGGDKINDVDIDINIKKIKIMELNKALFNEKVIDLTKEIEQWNYLGDKPAIIDFHAVWCGPCKQLAPILEKLAEQYKDEIVIYKVDVDKEQEIAAAFGIRSMPTLLFIPMQGQPQMLVGLRPKAELEKTINNILLAKE